MTYGELKSSKTTGFTTNHVIDDVINNGRFCFGKGFEIMLVSAHELSTIKIWADKEGVSFPPSVTLVWNGNTARQRVGGTFGS